jgi:hypothetical protein
MARSLRRFTRCDMSGPLIILVGIIYGYIAINQYMLGNTPMAIIYAGYAFSNVGLFLAIK